MRLFTATLFVFFSAAAKARVVSAYLWVFTDDRLRFHHLCVPKEPLPVRFSKLGLFVMFVRNPFLGVGGDKFNLPGLIFHGACQMNYPAASRRGINPILFLKGTQQAAGN
jgi:hypothetical protein